MDSVARFQKHVEINQSGCWEWTASRASNGYGVFTVGSRIDGTWRRIKAHRFSYESFVGPIPAGLTLDHLCRVRECVNPDHLEPCTLKENIRRGSRATQTHCKRGHELAGENLLRAAWRRGLRDCKACKRMLAREAYHGRHLPR